MLFMTAIYIFLLFIDNTIFNRFAIVLTYGKKYQPDYYSGNKNGKDALNKIHLPKAFLTL